MMGYVLKLTRSNGCVPLYAVAGGATSSISGARIFSSESDADAERSTISGIWRRKGQIVPVRTVTVTTTKVEEVPE